MSKLKVLLALLASFGLFFLFAREAQATHFRYGNITYTVPDPLNAPKTVRFDVITAWRADFIGDTDLNFGDGTTNGLTTGATIGSGVDSSGLQYKVQRYSATHTYPAKTTYTAFFTSCCRIHELTVSPDASFRIEAIVDLTTGNTSNPVSVLPAILQLQTGGIRTIDVPGIDPDGVPVHCRFATPAECLATEMPPTIPGGAAATLMDTPTGCTLTWNTSAGTANQRYAINIVLESFNGPTKSNAMLDFIVEMTTSPPPTCSGSGVFDVDLGEQFTQAVTGTNIGGGLLKMTNIGTFGNINPAPGTQQASPFITTYKVTPSAGDQGVQMMSIVYANSSNISGFCTIAIKTPACAVFGQACQDGIGGCLKGGYKYCNNGTELCSAVAGLPEAEKCDLIDNNCDGTVDENQPESGLACTSLLPGLCAPGLSACNAGVLSCIPNVLPGTFSESCDGIDQDCDGVVDNGFGIGSMCVEGSGECVAAGKVVCDGLGSTTCDADPGPPVPEECDGKDNNCDLEIDEGFNLGTTCENGLGICKATGVIVCDLFGGTMCDAIPNPPSVELCGDALDTDCDGNLNNDCLDTDGDDLYDPQEVDLGLDPGDADSDDDGVLDGDEPQFGADSDGDGLINALDPDSDNDGLFDGTELGLGCDNGNTDQSKGVCKPDADPSTKTDPLESDTDTGGATDGSEDSNLNGKVDGGEGDPTNAGNDDQIADVDGDGLGDDVEATFGTDPADADTDDDGLLDGLEANPTIDVDGDGLLSGNDVDSDNDALVDGLEAGKDCKHPDTDAAGKHCHFDGDPTTTTGVLTPDTDFGGVIDGSEDTNLNGVVGAKDTDPNDPADDGTLLDSDGDGLTDALEETLGSKANDQDSDDDGVFDGDEANPSDDADGDGQPNLMDPDADGDGLFDGTELGLDCSSGETDKSQGFCVADADGGKTKTNPLVPDTDGGGVNDGDEDVNHDGVVANGESDPNNPNDDVKPECQTDNECGVADSGKVCDESVCIPGCRGVSGNSCPANQLCTSSDDTIGECKDDGTGGTGGTGGDETNAGGGCGCRTASGPDAGALGLIAFAGLAAFAARRRRRR